MAEPQAGSRLVLLWALIICLSEYVWALEGACEIRAGFKANS